MGKIKVLKHAAKALRLNNKKGDWSSNWEFDWHLINDLQDITEESEYPVSMEEIESVLIALTKLGT